jgi:hypothetical protein
MTTEERLEVLERRQARACRWLLGVAGLAVAALILGAVALRIVSVKEQAEVIRAKRFIVEDNKGDGFAILGMSEGGGSLELCDKRGRLRVELGAHGDEPVLILRDETGSFRVALAVSKGGPVLDMFDEKGEHRVWLGVVKDVSTLALFDEKGKGGVAVGVAKEGPALSLADEKGEMRAKLAILKDGSGLALYDEKGKIRWSAP